jgi:hypothetical protein
MKEGNRRKIARQKDPDLSDCPEVRDPRWRASREFLSPHKEATHAPR